MVVYYLHSVKLYKVKNSCPYLPQMLTCIMADIAGIFYALKRILRVIIENLRAEISLAAHSG